MCRDGSTYCHFTTRGFLLYSRMYRISFLFRSATDLNIPRVITSREIFANHSSTWFSHDE